MIIGCTKEIKKYEEFNKRGEEECGYIKYDPKTNAVSKVTTYSSTGNTKKEAKPMISFYGELGKSFDRTAVVNVTTDKKLHTVRTPAGVFKDCILVKTIVRGTDTIIQFEHYYAKGFGEIKDVMGVNGEVIGESEIQSYEYF